MKKLRYCFAVLVVLLISTACGTSESQGSSTGMATVEDIISAQMAAEDDTADSESATSSEDVADVQESESSEDAQSTEPADAYAADVDLVGASATIVYGEIYSMVTTPMLYHGKTVKLTGYYDEYFDVMTNTLYCSVFVMDALACCAQGLQIEFSDSYAYPDDYPEDGSEMTIFATFEIYYPDPDSNVFFYHLVDTVVLE